MMHNNMEFDNIFKEKEENNNNSKNKKKSKKENEDRDCFEPICNKEDPLMKYRKYY
jgi:hypothetical protein